MWCGVEEAEVEEFGLDGGGSGEGGDLGFDDGLEGCARGEVGESGGPVPADEAEDASVVVRA